MKRNKTSFDIGKIELAFFTSLIKQLDSHLKIKLNGNKLYATDSVKHLEIQTEKNLTWKDQTNYVAIKKSLSSALHAILESHLSYASRVLAQNTKSVKRLHLLHKKSLRTMFFSGNSHIFVLLRDLKILKSFDKTALENFIFIRKRGDCHHSKAAGSNFHLNHTLMIQAEQIFITFKFPFNKLTHMVEIQ